MNLSWTDRLYVLLMLLMTFGMLAYSHLNGGADFHVFYVAGQRVWSGEPLYQSADGWMPFKYHPFWAVFFSFWSFLPEKLALDIFNVLHLGVWWIVANLWARILGYDLSSWKNRFLILLLALSPLSAEIGYGQINGFIFFLIMMIFLDLERPTGLSGRPGFWLSLIMSIKLNFGLMAFYMLIREWRALWGFVFGILLLHFATMVFFWKSGTGIYQEWIEMLLGQSSSQFNIFEAQGFLRLCMMISEEYGKWLWLVLLAGFIFGGWFIQRKKVALDVRWVYWMTGIFLFSPLAWWYQILFVYPLAFFLIKRLSDKKLKLVAKVCLGVFAVVTYNTLGHDGIIVFKTYMGFFIATMILVMLFLLNLARGKFSASPTYQL